MRHRYPRRTKWWGDSLIRCQGCGGLVTDATRYIAGGDSYVLCTPCLERNLNARRLPEGDDALSREASHYHP
jgi:hypothetical protein